MLYLLKVYLLVAALVFGLSGVIILVMLGWREAREYAVARQVMRRISASAPRERLAISRTVSQSRDAGSPEAA